MNFWAIDQYHIGDPEEWTKRYVHYHRTKLPGNIHVNIADFQALAMLLSKWKRTGKRQAYKV